ncbi:MAG: SUMF1/EgtB/PvdO family nonheme iron enzyme [Bryobacterales bacterium]|nr:SUMF1/EgtB/PvdO family nonheme iron enzyme [Bryobacteraceae bacterium]MDW8353327.1 SUMF1/EgtB/PvdO family nonheme iron enzyme [Bryobacterales bacterium]
MHSDQAAAMLRDARKRTLEIWADLDENRLKVTALPILNPPLWEMGHVAWIQEKLLLRQLHQRPPVCPDAESLWDAAAAPAHRRWDLPLSRAETLRYMQQVLDLALQALPAGELPAQASRLCWLAAAHEDWHSEASIRTRQTLGLPEPKLPEGPDPPTGHGRPVRSEDIVIPGGRFLLGASPEEAHAFDVEKPAHWREIQPFAISRIPTTNGQFLEFVEDGGYRRRELWSEEGWAWREREHAAHPLYWLRQGGYWFFRHFDLVVPLEEELPVVHVNWYEAEAYCRWARRRLPTEAEWEMAAAGTPEGSKRAYPWGESPPTPERAHLDARGLGCVPVSAAPAGESAFRCRHMIGNVWEWTAEPAAPYPGFEPDPMVECPERCFGEAYRVLRGGSWATRPRIARTTMRCLAAKERRDLFAGFRTCALVA